jgi:LPS sulfotransferase NodH
MAPFAADIDRFETLTRGRDWYETLVGVYLTAGFLNEFFLALAVSLPPKHRKVVKELLESDRTADVLVAAIRAGEEADPKLASRLALWGRRLMGDTQLVARSALRLSDNASDNASKLEPVFTDLVGSHSKRMDALGLTA